MYIAGGSVLKILPNASLYFTNNVASYGGAIYIDQTRCFVTFITSFHNTSFIFHNNHATSGSSIFSVQNWCASTSNAGCQAMQDAITIVSLPTTMLFNKNNSTSIFPGQTIVGDMTIIDCFGNVSSCIADVYLTCNGKICFNYELLGRSSIILSNGSTNTHLTLSRANSGKSDNPKLKPICKSSTEELPLALLIDVVLLDCPLGFIFNSIVGQCECAIKNADTVLICSKDIGATCVKWGYWYSASNNGVTECIHLFCDYSSRKCPPTMSPDSADYVLLGSTQDDQCINGHGGTLCTGCTHNKVPTYGALQCIDSDKCAKWHPYILVLLNIVGPFAYGIFLIAIMRFKLSIGSGYLYGPLFYLATLNLMPLSSYNTLKSIASCFVATFLLQFEILGFTPWCFFPSITLLTSKWFELIAPSVVAVVLLLTVYLARCSRTLFKHILKSPLQAMCLLMSVLFWSLANTAISVVTPVYLSGVKGARVHLQPDLAYLSGGHVPLWITSVVILSVLYSAVFLLMFSRFFNLHRCKPVLDEFRSCYRDRYHWYGGVYFITWTICHGCVLLSYYQMFQITIIILVVVHYLLQPYSKKWLNTMDGLLLCALSATLCLVVDSYSSSSIATKVMVYVSVMGPLCFISSSTVIITLKLGIVSRMMNIIIQKSLAVWNRRHDESEFVEPVTTKQIDATKSVVTVEEPQSEAAALREPLLYYLRDDASDT